ncbi:hypothetical protein J1C56_18915 [Aminobacter anthyllidis]|uniref:Uncharacterized protein n=1 Tax=Aminobacter anthyllidis TaxID=1035067 RepID=A0A9X1D7A3_9HYPH|nr:hypothetical protein [Aminobacter anthyllidis]MBT1157669.1 hypothetical protein [Aminobacter anthyllidis]
MTNTNDENAALRKFRTRHVGLDLDVKLLRLRLKAGFNPAQPRVPAGDPNGGQWTDNGGGAGRSRPDRNLSGAGSSPGMTPGPGAGTASASKPVIDRARIVARVGSSNRPGNPHVRHTVSLPGGRRFVFQTEGTRQTVLDGAGNPISKTLWTPHGPMSQPVVRLAGADDTQGVFDAARQLYNRLSATNTLDQRACLAFTAKEFRPDGSLLTPMSFVGMLSRAETEKVCSKLTLVQRLSDEAMQEAKLTGPYPNATVFGTAVHTRLHKKILALKDSTLTSEQSLLKRMEETLFDFSAVRVDVLEDRNVGPICVYDLKTGRRGLSRSRAIEFARRLAFHGRPIIIIEVRPYE